MARPTLADLIADPTLVAKAGDIRQEVGITSREFHALDRAVIAGVGMRALSLPEVPQAMRDAATPDAVEALGATLLMFSERRLAAVLLRLGEMDLLHNIARVTGEGVH